MAYVPDEAIDRSHEINQSAFRLYCYYCKRRDKETGTCYPSLKTTATELKMAYSYASEMRAQLIAKQWIAPLPGGEILLLVGFPNASVPSEIPKDVSEKPKQSSEKPKPEPVEVSEKPKEVSEFPKGVSEKPKESFGKTETHIRNNQPNEPAHLTSPLEPEEEHVELGQLDASDSAPSGPRATDVREVFAYWQQQTGHSQAKLTADRKTKITARLREGYTVEQIKLAIDGCLLSPFHRGQNEEGRVYDDLELICRSGSKLEKFIGYTRPASKLNGVARAAPDDPLAHIDPMSLSAKTRGNLEAGRRFIARGRDNAGK